MTLALRYAVRSDVGLLREGNEDSAYAGPRLLAVADGMGGHAAGEVASAVVISALADLDDDLPEARLKDALAEAVARANRILHDMVAADPSIGGMGTTLTALLWAGSQIALCHIGDSRAYVLSDGEFAQITHDHTLVQSLIDDGRISPDEAATHPQRSLLLRALDGTPDVEADISLREARPGDRYLLCSDGLSGVVSEETLHRTLAAVSDPDDAVRQLVELAIKGGGPDNITCIVADVIDNGSVPAPAEDSSVIAGAASNGGARPTLRTNSPAGRAHVLTQTAPQAAIVIDHDDPAPQRTAPPGDTGERPRRRWPVVTSILGLLIVVIVGGGYGAWRYTQSQYYVGTWHGKVVIYQGINQSVAGIALSHVYQHTGIPVSGLPATDQASVKDTTSPTGLTEAQRTVAQVRADWQQCQQSFAALRHWYGLRSVYQNRLRAYEQRYHTTKKVTNKHGKVVATPPGKFTQAKPVLMAGCPRPHPGAGGAPASPGATPPVTGGTP